MAKFHGFEFRGLDGLIFSLEELAEMPEQLIEDMLNAEGEVVKRAHEASLRQNRLYKTGTLSRSIMKRNKIRLGKDGKWFITVYPSGTHSSYIRTKLTKVYARSKHGRTYTVGGDLGKSLNQDVGFVLEFGAPKRKIAGRHWMASANEASSTEAVNAAYKVYDKFLQSKNL